MSRLASVLLALVLVSLVACSGNELVLPDRASAAVRAEEQRIATLLESSTDLWFPGECRVRLLRQDGSTSYVWATCEGYEEPNAAEKSGRSLPLRVDDEKVSAPGDGSLFSDDVNRMFPADLADAIFDRDERIVP